MAMHVQNITFHILHNFLSLSPICWILLSLFPIGRDLHFLIQIQIASNFIIHIMKGLKQSPSHVHDVAGKSAIYYLHHEGA
jgi:hypothetical protein